MELVRQRQIVAEQKLNKMLSFLQPLRANPTASTKLPEQHGTNPESEKETMPATQENMSSQAVPSGDDARRGQQMRSSGAQKADNQGHTTQRGATKSIEQSVSYPQGNSSVPMKHDHQANSHSQEALSEEDGGVPNSMGNGLPAQSQSSASERRNSASNEAGLFLHGTLHWPTAAVTSGWGVQAPHSPAEPGSLPPVRGRCP